MGEFKCIISYPFDVCFLVKTHTHTHTHSSFACYTQTWVKMGWTCFVIWINLIILKEKKV